MCVCGIFCRVWCGPLFFLYVDVDGREGNSYCKNGSQEGADWKDVFMELGGVSCLEEGVELEAAVEDFYMGEPCYGEGGVSYFKSAVGFEGRGSYAEGTGGYFELN